MEKHLLEINSISSLLRFPYPGKGLDLLGTFLMVLQSKNLIENQRNLEEAFINVQLVKCKIVPLKQNILFLFFYHTPGL